MVWFGLKLEKHQYLEVYTPWGLAPLSVILNVHMQAQNNKAVLCDSADSLLWLTLLTVEINFNQIPLITPLLLMLSSFLPIPFFPFFLSIKRSLCVVVICVDNVIVIVFVACLF